MPIQLPNLDDRTFDDLVEEARGLIPAYGPTWTDHNESDPGITLIELFAWLAEMLVYRANQVPDRHVVAFLRLLNGPDWRPGPHLEEDVAATLRGLRARYQAVTCEDWEELAAAASPRVARAHCVARRYLGAGSEAARLRDRPGHVSVVIVPGREEGDGEELPLDGLLRAVWTFLDERRVLTTRHHVVGALNAPVSAEILARRRSDVPTASVRASVAAALERFLDRLDGGPDGGGWAFGRSIYVSEVYELLERLPGVDHVLDVGLTSECTQETGCAPAREVWHESGDLVELAIEPHHLPAPRISADDVIVSDRYATVRIAVAATPAPGTEPTAVRRAVKTSLRRLFHPLHDWSGEDGEGGFVTLTRLRTRVGRLAEVKPPARVEVETDPAHELRDDAGELTGVLVDGGELVDLQVDVEVEEATG
jgi:hypothetical protein